MAAFASSFVIGEIRVRDRLVLVHWPLRLQPQLRLSKQRNKIVGGEKRSENSKQSDGGHVGSESSRKLFNFGKARLLEKPFKFLGQAMDHDYIFPMHKGSSKLARFGASLQQIGKARNLPSAVCNAAESLITLMEPSTRSMGSDPLIQLKDNFAPVAEECPPHHDLEITGTLPQALNGVYIRNGSNPRFLPTGGYHQFDGDGMLHAIRIKDGAASYCCRYTQTYRFTQESKGQQPLFANALGELNGMPGFARLGLFAMRCALGVVEGGQGMGSANAGLAFHNGRLLAMSEDDMPYAVTVSPEDGDLRTLGRLDFNGMLTNAMTAHPKVDPSTGELFAYGYNVLVQPYLKYFRVSPDGEMSPSVPISSCTEPIILHDFVVTERFAVFPEPQLVFNMLRMFKGKSAIFPDESKVPRIGVLPKYATNEANMKWFDVPDSTCIHYLNGWDEGDEVVLVGSNVHPIPEVLNNPALLVCHLTEFRLNLANGTISRRKITETNLDSGQINPRYVGKKNRYAYMSMYGPWPKYSGIAKVDFQAPESADVGHECYPGDVCGGVTAMRKFPTGCFGSEPCFVPKSSDPNIAEDDGYIVTYTHDEFTNVSEFLVLDAQSPTLEPVATVRIPARVPYGFHGIFLTEEQLSRQNTRPLQRQSGAVHASYSHERCN